MYIDILVISLYFWKNNRIKSILTETCGIWKNHSVHSVITKVPSCAKHCAGPQYI